MVDLLVLKCKKVVVIQVEYTDLEVYIKKLTGKGIEIPCMLECGNNTSHEIKIGEDLICPKDKEEAESFLFGKSKSFNDLYTLMEVMYLHGLLEKGTYLINVSW